MTSATTMTTAAKIEAVAALIRRANEAARAADPGQAEDGGTCNMDTPTIRLRGAREATMLSIAAKSGVCLSLIADRGFWRGTYWVYVALNGQGNRRCVMMEAAMRVLREGEGAIPGYSAVGYYQMD